MDKHLRERRPLVGQMRDSIWRMINEEGFHPWDRLPTEQKLSERFQISRGALREALRVLEEERVIICQHGVGRFVAPQPTDMLSEDITHLMSTTELARSLGITFTSRYLSSCLEEGADSVRSLLGLKPGDLVVTLERVWQTLEGPILYSIDYFPRSLLHSNPDPDLFNGSLLELLEREGQRRLDYSKTTIRAVLLDSEVRHRIDAHENMPWILLEQVNYDPRGNPFLYSLDYHNSEKFQFRVLRRRR